MTALQKEYLYSKWNSCDKKTKTHLASKYLTILRESDEEISWLQFLQGNLLENKGNSEKPQTAG